MNRGLKIIDNSDYPISKIKSFTFDPTDSSTIYMTIERDGIYKITLD